MHDGAVLAIQVGNEAPFTLLKHEGGLTLNPTAPASPDMTFFLGDEIPGLLDRLNSNDISEIGISIFNWIFEADQKKRITAKIHVDSFSILKKGYFGVLAQGGLPVMQYLAGKGLGSLAKIKSNLSKLRR